MKGLEGIRVVEREDRGMKAQARSAMHGRIYRELEQVNMPKLLATALRPDEKMAICPRGVAENSHAW